MLKLSPISSIGKSFVLGSLLATSVSVLAVTQPLISKNNSTSEIISKEGAGALRAAAIPQIKSESEEEIFGKAYVLSRDADYQQKLDKRYKETFGDNKVLDITEIMSKDKNLAQAVRALDSVGNIHYNKILSLDNDAKTMDEIEYKMLCTLIDSDLMSDDEFFDWHAFITYKYTKTSEVDEFDKRAANDRKSLLEDLNNKYDKKNIDDVAKLISRYYFRAIYGPEIIDEYLGAYKDEISTLTTIGSNGISYLPFNAAGVTIAVDEISGDVRIRTKPGEFNVYDWSGNFNQKRTGGSLFN